MHSEQIEKLPTPLSPDERTVYLPEPPIPLEFGQVNGKIVVKKCLDEALALPVGSELLHINDQTISGDAAGDTLRSLQDWSSGTASKEALRLRFFLKPEVTAGKLSSTQQGADTGDLVRNTFIRDIGVEFKARLDIDLCTSFIKTLCSINSWDRTAVVAQLDRLMEDYKQVVEIKPFWLATENDSSASSTSVTTQEKDLLDNIYAGYGSGSGDNLKSENDYLVSLVSRQLGMTVENVFERTVVRSIHPNSEAYRLDVKTSSVILNIGSSSTLFQTHLETLAALKNTVRPVKLRLCQIDEKELARYRVEMHGLVQRQKNSTMGAASVLNVVEHQLLWVLEMYAFAEAVRCSDLQQRAREGRTQGLVSTSNLTPDVPTHTYASASETDSVGSALDSGAGCGQGQGKRSEHEVNGGIRCEEYTNHPPPTKCIDRAIKAMEIFEATRRVLLENERKEALVAMRCSALSDVMYEIRDCFDWQSGRLRAATALGESHLAGENQYRAAASPADFLNAALRSICLKILQITNDQQTDLREVFPDRATCDVLDLLVRNSLTAEVIRMQHIPALWKLAGSVSVAARIACANLVPLLYMNLSELQQLRIRGLINRLMVDSVGAVRAYVLSSVCVRILRAVVQRQYNKDEDDGSSCSDALGTGASVTLNWIAHCMIQGSTDIEVDVRKGSLLACKNLIEYSALGTEEEGGVNCDLIEEMRTYISDNISLPTFVPEKVLRPQLSEVHILCCRVLPIISRLVEDNQAYIRGSVVSMIGDFCIWMGGKWSAILLDVLLCCFRDGVPEVRAAALTAVPHAVLALIQAAIKADEGPREHAISKLFISLIPSVCSMHRDVSVPVRVGLCTALSRVLTLCYSVTINGQLSSFSLMSRLETSMFEVVLLLLEDKSIQVCTQMIVELAMSVEKEHHHGYSSYTSAVFTVANAMTIIRSVSLLSKQTNWRVRKMVCAIIPKLVSCSTTVELRSAISDIAQTLLFDPVFEVRRSAARAMCIAAECDGVATGLALPGGVTPDGEPLQDMGRMWLDCVVLPQLESLRTSRVYSNRILSLHMIATIIVEDIVHEGDVRYDILINIALTHASDRVSNVRIALCEVLVVLAPLIRQDGLLYEAVTSQAEENIKAAATSTYHRSNCSLPNMVRSAIAALQQDGDRDVAFLADKASRYIDQCAEEGEGCRGPGSRGAVLGNKG